MKYLIMTIFMAMLISATGTYAQDLPDDNETIVNISKEIVGNLRKLKFGEVVKYCFPGSELEDLTKNQAAEYESDKEDPSILEFKQSKISYLNNVFDIGDDKGIVVCKTDKKDKREFILWIFKKHQDTWYIYSWKNLAERQL